MTLPISDWAAGCLVNISTTENAKGNIIRPALRPAWNRRHDVFETCRCVKYEACEEKKLGGVKSHMPTPIYVMFVMPWLLSCCRRQTWKLEIGEWLVTTWWWSAFLVRALVPDCLFLQPWPLSKVFQKGTRRGQRITFPPLLHHLGSFRGASDMVRFRPRANRSSDAAVAQDLGLSIMSRCRWECRDVTGCQNKRGLTRHEEKTEYSRFESGLTIYLSDHNNIGSRFLTSTLWNEMNWTTHRLEREM